MKSIVFCANTREKRQELLCFRATEEINCESYPWLSFSLLLLESKHKPYLFPWTFLLSLPILKYHLDIWGWRFHTVPSHWDSQPGVKPLRPCWVPSSSQPPLWLPEHADVFSLTLVYLPFPLTQQKHHTPSLLRWNPKLP